ncbi:hypothetical protein AOLI_G00193160 [Acnodon oligacanthus]
MSAVQPWMVQMDGVLDGWWMAQQGCDISKEVAGSCFGPESWGESCSAGGSNTPSKDPPTVTQTRKKKDKPFRACLSIPFSLLAETRISTDTLSKKTSRRKVQKNGELSIALSAKRVLLTDFISNHFRGHRCI